MLRTETVTPRTLEILKELMRDPLLAPFFLVGGTALSLQIRHRISIDIDLFSQTAFDVNNIAAHLENVSGFQLGFVDANTLKGEIDTIRVGKRLH